MSRSLTAPRLTPTLLLGDFVDWPYWRTAVASVGRNLRRRDFVHALANSGLIYDERLRLRAEDMHEVYPDLARQVIDLGPMRYGRSNMTPTDLFVLAGLCRLRDAQTVFEIGTYDGATTAVLARACPNASIITLDLPESAATTAVVPEERDAVRGYRVGERFAGTDLAERITQLRADSRSFDFSPWFGKVDVVLVDGGHEEDCVSADTRNALAMVRPGGVIVWDDYIAGWPAVVSAVENLPEDIRRHAFRLHGTSIAICDPKAR